jgi:hypothetical protein
MHRYLGLVAFSPPLAARPVVTLLDSYGIVVIADVGLQGDVQVPG